MNDLDAHGPVENLVIEFPAHIEGRRSVQALLELVDARTIRLMDVVLLRKDLDGTVTIVDLNLAVDLGLAAWSALATARSGMFGAEDIEIASDAIRPGTVAALVLYENTWAVPFVAAAVSEGGRVMASSRLTAVEVMAQYRAAERR